MMNKLKVLSAVVACVLLLTSVGHAETVMPRADEVFTSAYAYLFSNKNLQIHCIAYSVQNTITITSCWTEKKIDNEWVPMASIWFSPSSVSNDISIGIETSIAAYIGTGTYRVGFTVNADGHAITRYSNECTY